MESSAQLHRFRTIETIHDGQSARLDIVSSKIDRAAIAALLISMALPLQAEVASYGEVYLNGLARDQWGADDFHEQTAMVCNVNGRDGFLTIRTGPGSSYPKARALNRLAVVTLDISKRQGHWVRVLHADRRVTKDGVARPHKPLPVQGWAHDNYLCDFIH